MQPKRSKIQHLKNLVEDVKKIPIKSRVNDDESYSRLNESSFDFTPHDASNIHSEMNDHYNKILDASGFDTRTINERIVHDPVEDEMLNNLEENDMHKMAFAKENIEEDNGQIITSQNNIDNKEQQMDNQDKKSIKNELKDREADKSVTNPDMDDNSTLKDTDGETSLKRPKPKISGKKIPINLPPPTRPKMHQRTMPKLTPPKVPFSETNLKLKEEPRSEELADKDNKEVIDDNKNRTTIPEQIETSNDKNEEPESKNNNQTSTNELMIGDIDNNDRDRSTKDVVKGEEIKSDKELENKEDIDINDKALIDDSKQHTKEENQVELTLTNDGPQLNTDEQLLKKSNFEEQNIQKIEKPVELKSTPVKDKVMELSDFLDIKNNLITLKKELNDTKSELNHYKRICHKYVHPETNNEKMNSDDFKNQIFALKEENERLKEALAEARSVKTETANNYNKLDKTDTDYEDLIEELKSYYNKLFEENNIIISEKENQITNLVIQNKQLLHQHRTDESTFKGFDDFFANIQSQFDKINEVDNIKTNQLLSEIRDLDINVSDEYKPSEIQTVINIQGADDDLLKKAFEFIDANKGSYDMPIIKEVPQDEIEINKENDEKEPSSVDTVIAEDEFEDTNRIESKVIYEEKNEEKSEDRIPEIQPIVKDDELSAKLEKPEIAEIEHVQKNKSEDNAKSEEEKQEIIQEKLEKQIDEIQPSPPMKTEFVVELANKVEDKSLLDQISTVDVKNLEISNKDSETAKEVKVEPKKFNPIQKRKLKVTQMPVDQKLFDNEEENNGDGLGSKSQLESPGVSTKSRKIQNAFIKDKPVEQPEKKLTNIFTQKKVARPPKPVI